jgi:hypothetical protein
MRYMPMLFLLMLLNACAIYHYKFNSEDMTIAPKGKHCIEYVTIECNERMVYEIFRAIEGKGCSNFSLMTFSPEYFKCAGGSFRFDTGVVYSIRAKPAGDASGVPVMVKLQSDGKLIRIP